MAMEYLSLENCNKAEQANNVIESLPERLRLCAEAFRSSVDGENFKEVLEKNENNKITKYNILKYCDSIEQMASTLERLHQTISSLVLNSRRAIRTSSMENDNE